MLYRRCDRCGKDLPRNLQAETPRIKWVTIIAYDTDGRNVWEADLCPKCSAEIRDASHEYSDNRKEGM